jgi:hypothetical protein
MSQNKRIDTILAEVVLGWEWVQAKDLKELGIEMEGEFKGDKYLKFFCPPDLKQIISKFKEGQNGNPYHLKMSAAVPPFTKDLESAMELVNAMKWRVEGQEFILSSVRNSDENSPLIWKACYGSIGTTISADTVFGVGSTPAEAICAWALNVFQVDPKRYAK